MAPDPARADDTSRAALALWSALIALAAARLALAFVPNMWGWGLNLQRFLDPATAWMPWLIVALALFPGIARPLERPFARLGDALVGSPGIALALAAAMALVVFANPDRVRYVGDFMIRQGVADQAGRPSVLFPQAQPLDLLIHYHLPVALQHIAGWGGNLTARLIGALDAAALALCAGVFVRALALRGGAALAAWSVVVCGGYLGMFTGYSKAVSEVAVLTAAVGAFGVWVAREGRGRLGLGVSLALAIALHRSALALVPGAIVALTLDARRMPGAWRRPAFRLAVGLPLIALATVAAHIVSRIIHADIGILLAPAAARQHGLLGALLAPARNADVLNVIALLSPLALAAPLLAWRLGRDRLRGGAGVVLIALAAPFTLLLLALHPPQGLFRDWDVFAGAGVVLSLLAAALVGRALSGAGRRGWIAVAVTLSVALPAFQWLAHSKDPGHGLARVAAYLGEPPVRSGSELATSWDWLGTNSYRMKRWDAAAHAWARAAETAPSRRILDQWIRAELAQGHLREAQSVFHRMLARDSTDAQAWLGLAGVASRIPDPEDSRRAVRKVLELQPDSREAREIEAYLERNYPQRR